MAAGLQISTAQARRFAWRAVGLERPAGSVGEALDHLGFVQIDPIHVCGRMHDLILRNRVAGYTQGSLMRHLHGGERTLRADERTAFEHHAADSSNLAAFPLDAWPHLLAAMQARTGRDGFWSGRLTPDEAALAPDLLAEMARRGPVSSRDFQDGRRTDEPGWGTASLAKSALQKLFFHGRVLIARREGTRRFYDLPERVLPAAVLAMKEATAEETARWLVLAKLRQRRLVWLGRADLAIVADRVVPVRLSDRDAPVLHILEEDMPLLDEEPDGMPPRLLAPLDPLIYDRRVTRALWDFDYTWEVYTPPAKRVRGYYALPLLSRGELAGHVEPRLDAKAGRLEVLSKSIRRGHASAAAVKELARFLGAK